MQVARGSAQTDSDGLRQATVPHRGTTARLFSRMGRPFSTNTLNVRLTEYTNRRGPQAMPADLPDRTYTYAVGSAPTGGG
jgi:hypothetical protein